MSAVWDFGGAFADTAGKLQKQDFERLAFPAEKAQSEAATRLNNANASLVEHRLSSEKRMAEIMQGATLEGDEGGSAAIMKMAGVAMKAGDATTARDLILRATQASSHEAQASYREAQERKAQTEQRIKMAGRYATLMQGVQQSRDPRTAFAQANALFQQEFGEAAPVMEYDPQTVQLLYDSSVKMRDKVYMDHLKVTERQADARINETRRYHNETLDVRRAAADQREREGTRKAKEGGKDVGAPSGPEVKQAAGLLASQGKAKGLDKATRERAAVDLASRARALRKSNPGLDASEARTRALVEQVAEGYYATEKATGLGGLLGRTWTVYGKPGATPDRPVPAPKDAKARKAGTYYTTPKGTLLYLGEGKWQMPDPASIGEEDEDDE